MRYMTEDAFLSIFEINIGMTADVGTFPRICKLLPEGVVKELAYTGRKMSAKKQKRWAWLMKFTKTMKRCCWA
jgi:enoyl-CoA hydratase